MGVYQVNNPKAEVKGEYILPILDCAGPFRDAPLQILAEFGIPEPDPNAWYSMQAYLNTIKKVAEKMGPATLGAIGKWVPEDVPWVDNISSLQDGLNSINTVYAANHRNGDVGSFKYEKVDDKSGKLICNTPYPDELDRGIIEAVARKFKEKSMLFVRVKLETSLPTRTKGADTSTFIVSW
jgi:hypothetical protein